ncbi:MAG: amidase [Actinobacteria bacterium]|nr:amidase [Actinomycetota bacterium]
MATAHAFGDDLAGLDAVATAAAVRSGEVSAEEVVRAAIARARAIDPLVAAVAFDDYERAPRRARAVADGPLAGVPTFIKDMTDVAGLPTRNGSAAFAGARPATRTFGIAQQLFDMGAVGLGKSTLPEFGFTPSTEFPDDDPTRNPWNLDRSPGGSSGGAAVLVAAGVVPLAHGQDGGGSIRLSASCNGLVGLKSSRGRLLPDPHDRLLPVRIVVDGVLTRTVRDTATYFAEAERRYRSKHLLPLGDVTRPVERRLRIGALIDSPTGVAADEPTRRAFDDAVALLEALGHEVVPVAAPVDERFAEDFIHYWSMLAWSVTIGGRLLFDRSFDARKLTLLTRGLADRFRSKIATTPGVVARLRRSNLAYQAQFDDLRLDVVLSPTLVHLPPELGHLGTHLHVDVLFPRVEQWVGFTPLANATGAPAISLPLGHDEATNLPIGMMFSAPVGHDGLLLRLALELEAARPFRSLAGS